LGKKSVGRVRIAAINPGARFEPNLSFFKNCRTHFERTQKRPSAQKPLAFEKSVQEQSAA
jgi:hypothetical protein